MTISIPFVSRQPSAEQGAWVAALQRAMPDYRIVKFGELDAETRASAQVAIAANPDPRELALLPRLGWVQSLWAGVERMLAEMPGASFDIVRMTDPQLAETMAEAVLTAVLYLHRDMPRYRAQQLAGSWVPHRVRLPSERTIGILGMGAMGRRAAEKLVLNGFNVCGWNRSGHGDRPDGVKVFHGPTGLGEVLCRSNILVVLLPLTAETRGLVDAPALKQLPKGATVINFGRGPIVDTHALMAQLDAGALSHAVLDVFDREPLPPESPLWAHPGITILPHVAAPTTMSTAAIIAADNIGHYFRDGTMPDCIDKGRGY